MAKPYRRKGSKYWQIAPTINGVQVPQSSRTTDYDRADRKLKILEGQIAAGAPIQPKTDRGDIAALLELVRSDYKVHGKRSLKDLERRLDKHLLPMIGHLQANLIQQAWPEYVIYRKGEKAANGSINQERSHVLRGFALGKRLGLVLAIPHLEKLESAEPRNISYSDEQLASIVRKRNQLLTDLLTIYAFTGWRRSSVFLLEWSQVDFKEGFISLKPEQTKNRKMTRFPLVSQLREILERRKAETDALQKKYGKIIPWVFHRNGTRVKSIRKAFENARKAAGVPGHRIHDFRRTAVRTLHDLGYDAKIIMDMCGFKTEAMVHRYIGITSDSRLKEAGKALETRRAKMHS